MNILLFSSKILGRKIVMNRPPFFSIIIPAYNCETQIQDTIISIYKQSFLDFEVIIVNDGSKDNTKEVIESLEEKYQNVYAFTQENTGPGGARNFGITKAKGTYLIFIDSDDTLLSNMLERYHKILSEKDLDLIVGSFKTSVYDGYRKVSENQTIYPNKILNSHREFLDELYPLMESQMMYVVWNKVYKRDIIVKNNIKFPHYKSCEDRIFNLRYYHHVETIEVLEEPIFEYSFDGKYSLTNKYFDNKFETFLHFYAEVLRLVEKDYEGYSSLFLKGVMSCLMALHSNTCPLSYQEKKRYIQKVLDNETVNEASNVGVKDSMMKKVIVNLLGSDSVFLNYQASKMMFIVSTTSPKVIERFKSNY